MKLSPSMTCGQFDNGYWYATELKAFAERLGLPQAALLRKDELERAIKTYLSTGKLAVPTKRKLKPEGPKDAERGLGLSLTVERYNNDTETKDFLEREAKQLQPSFRRRSGLRYRFNRWREEQLTKGVALTYRDLVAAYVELNGQPFEKIAVGRYINFLSEFLSSEPNATHARARRAWKQLKTMDVPKNYQSWRRQADARSPTPDALSSAAGRSSAAASRSRSGG